MIEAETLLSKYYLEDNFEIITFNNRKKRSRICYVFFSSNGLYKSRNDVELIKKMHDDRRYEWSYISKNKRINKTASKIIFMRDIYKTFYIFGVNKQMNSIDKIKNFLVKETFGMKVILSGSSAGAYMALLLANMLPNTIRVLSLGGVVDLDDWKNFSVFLSENIQKSDYYNIQRYLYGNYWIINFFGINNDIDKKNANIINRYSNNKTLLNIALDDECHAPRPSGDDLIRILTCSERHLIALKKRLINIGMVKKKTFQRYNMGFFWLFFDNIKSVLAKAIRQK